MMKRLSLFLALALALCAAPALAQQDAAALWVYVSDPTGTPTNVRAAPGGVMHQQIREKLPAFPLVSLFQFP